MSAPRGGFCGSSSTPWLWEENKRFEDFLALIPDNVPDRWSVIAKALPSRSPLELKLRYKDLLAVIADTDAGRVSLPWPLSEQEVGREEKEQADQEAKRETSTEEGQRSGTVSVTHGGLCGSSSIPWSCEEKKRFEDFLALNPDDRQDRWNDIAKWFSGRSPLELKHQYDEMLVDIADTEAGRVPLPWPLPLPEQKEQADQEKKKELLQRKIREVRGGGMMVDLGAIVVVP